MHKYYENKDDVAHGCCWDTAIFIEAEEKERGIYSNNQKRVLECDNEDVDFILKALNSTSRLWGTGELQADLFKKKTGFLSRV